MGQIALDNTLSLEEAKTAIETVGSEVSIMLLGEPGIGKSTILKMLAAPGRLAAYIDCTLLDVGDAAIPYTVEENGQRVTRFAPNARFLFHMGQPVDVLLDEVGKARKAVKDMLLPLLLEGRLADMRLPGWGEEGGSRVIGATNLLSDGLGDMLEGHALNRVTTAEIRKPYAGFLPDGSIDQKEGFAQWAINNDVPGEVIAWVKMNPHVLDSYRNEDPSTPAERRNPYIWRPTMAGTQAVVTPRSLYKAGHIVRKRNQLGASLTSRLLAGTVGPAAAADLRAFLAIADKLPAWESVVASPESAHLPDDPMARVILTVKAINAVSEQTLAAVFKYVQRMEDEHQAMFCKSMINNTRTQAWAVKCREFRDHAQSKQWMYA